jgi:hypothetical protein
MQGQLSVFNIQSTSQRKKLDGMNPTHREFSEPYSDQDLTFAILQFKNKKSLREWLEHTTLGTLKTTDTPPPLSRTRTHTRLVAKAVVRMVARSMNYKLETSIILASKQAGFRQYSSTQRHVAMFSQNIKGVLLQRKYLKCCGFLL